MKCFRPIRVYGVLYLTVYVKVLFVTYQLCFSG